MRVSDLEATLDFYQRVFGLKVTRRHESPRGSKLAFLSVPNSEEEIEITYFPGSGPVEVQEDLMHLAFEVESMDEFQKHLDSVGEKLSDGPTKSSSVPSLLLLMPRKGMKLK